ncbi:MAG: polysaccharide deacetylase family protein [Verrucomicrobiota bacterium]
MDFPSSSSSTISGPAPERDGHADAPRNLPDCYTSLVSFAPWLESGGTAALMYHKLGPRPPRVRLKGLYVAERLFRRQLSELKSAGYTAVDPGALGSQGGGGARRIALTFDDGFENVLRLGLGPLREHGFRAIQYLVPGLLGGTNEWEQRQGEAVERLMDAAQVREWLAAGHWIGAHTRTHPWLTKIPLGEAREEIRSSKLALEDLFGVPIRHFCYPYGDWNRPVRDLVEAAGFETACTTRPGINLTGGDPFLLRRLTARHVSLKWRTLGTWIRVALASRG